MSGFNATEFFKNFGQIFVTNGSLVRPAVKCQDGYKVSIQASECHYCSPRKNFLDSYDAVELGFPNQIDDELIEYAEDPDEPMDTVYGWVPIELVDEVIMKHGGIVKLVYGTKSDCPREIDVSVF